MHTVPILNAVKRGESGSAIFSAGSHAFALNLYQKIGPNSQRLLAFLEVVVHVIDAFDAGQLVVQAHFRDVPLYAKRPHLAFRGGPQIMRREPAHLWLVLAQPEFNRRPYRVRINRPVARRRRVFVVATHRQNERRIPGPLFQLVQPTLDRLSQRYLDARPRLRFRNAPYFTLEIEVRPLSGSQFAGTYGRRQQQANGKRILSVHVSPHQEQQFIPAQHQAPLRCRTLAQQCRQVDADARIGCHKLAASGMPKQHPRSGQQRARLNPWRADVFDHLHDIQWGYLRHHIRAETGLYANQVAAIALLRTDSQTDHDLVAVVVDQLPHRPVLHRQRFHAPLVDGGVTRLIDMRTLFAGNLAGVGQADVGEVADGEFFRPTGSPIA